jgi:hypothetical protein
MAISDIVTDSRDLVDPMNFYTFEVGLIFFSAIVFFGLFFWWLDG